MTLPAQIAYALPGSADLPAPTVPWRLDADRAVLLVHDMQQHFMSAFDQTQDPARTLVSHVAELLSGARAAGVPVVYTAQPADQRPDQRGLLTDFWGTGLTGDTAAARIIDAVAPQEGDVVLPKWRYDAFARSDLAERLHAARRDQLVITGVYGHIGCLVTAIRAFMQDIQPFVVADALADFGRQEHQMTLDYVSGRCGVVTTTAEVMQVWTSGGGTSCDAAMDGLRRDLALLLDLDEAQITPEADLTLLGLDSVRALTLIDRWSQSGVDVDLLELLDDPTPAGILRLTQSGARAGAA